MAANSNSEYKVFKYYEGLCSSANFTKEIAKVLSLGVKSQAITDEEGNIIANSEVIQSKNWDIVYPLCDSTISWVDKTGNTRTLVLRTKNGIPDTSNLSDEEYTQKILNQVNKISDTVILSTVTTEKSIGDDVFDDLTVDTSSNSAQLKMYLEIFKPTYIANPEEYPLDCERVGITPQVITKELYKQAYKTSGTAEDALYLDTTKCTKEKQSQEELGDCLLAKEECNGYLRKICNVMNNDGAISIPTDELVPSVVVLDKSYLTKIKQQEAELYTLITNTLRGGEGIEPKEYSQLTELEVEVFKTLNDNNEVAYLISFKGTTERTIYTIPKGTTFTTSKMPNISIVPELYLNGVYTPLDSTKYHAGENTIFIDENVTFAAETDGVLVVRYTYNTPLSNNGVISERTTLLNNHYVLMRLFDEIDTTTYAGPKDNIYNSSGEIIKTNSHISPWSKLSWYQDFEEIMIDTIDSDIGVNNIQDGTKLVPLETPGLNADTKMRYYINTNNDRFSLIVMGNPSLDYERDRHIISGCYCGRIDSFENSINDTAGNFALFTCSSTEPCDTSLKTSKEELKRGDEIISLADIVNDIKKDEAEVIINQKCGFSTRFTKDRTKYEIQLNDKTYFNRGDWPKYIIAEVSEQDGVYTIEKALTGLNSLQTSPSWVMSDGKADSAVFTIRNDDAALSDMGNVRIFFYFSYYTEKYTIKSGIERDVFGNVINVEKIKTYGNNTSDGVTSIMMYHTRSKAYYQKHHMLFATTEEYMSKVMYGKSAYTGEYYADRIKVTHGNDGPRGTLGDLLVIDSASLYALDELVINKDFKIPEESEETFVFFPITAPYSPLSDSPNATYGLAIKKAEVEPQYLDESKIVKIAVEQLKTLYTNKIINDSLGLIDTSQNGCDVYWKVVPGSEWYEEKGNPATYKPFVIAMTNDSKYGGDPTQQIVPTNTLILSVDTSTQTDKDCTVSSVIASGFTPDAGDKLYYGISDTPITTLNKDAHLFAVLYDGAQDDTTDDDNGGWVYNLDGIPYTALIGDDLPTTGGLQIMNAAPEKYLVVYSVKEEDIPASTGVERSRTVKISKFDCQPLTKSSDPYPNDLLKYPSLVNISAGGEGKMINIIDNPNSNEQVGYIHTTVLYETEIKVPLIPAPGWEINDIKATYTDGTTEMFNIETNIKNGLSGFTIPDTKVKQDIRVEVAFTKIP